MTVRFRSAVSDEAEDRWEIPARWWATAEPFRGLNAPAQHRPDPAAASQVQRILTRHRPALIRMLARTRDAGLTDLAAAGEAYVEHPDTAVSPLGAAAVYVIVNRDYRACCMSMSRHWDHMDSVDTPNLVDSWIIQHGVEFAAEAAVRQSGLTANRPRPGAIDWSDRLEPLDDHKGGVGGAYSPAWWMRVRLAAAPEADHRAVLERLAVLRSDPGTDWAGLTTSYLAPHVQDWVDADLSLTGLTRPSAAWRLLASLTTMEQFERYITATGGDSYRWDAHLYNVLTQIGPDSADKLVQRLGGPRAGHAGFDELLAILVRLPRDVAYQALLDHHEREPVAKALTQATVRYPRRAMRLLSRQLADTGEAEFALRLQIHARRHPRLASEPTLVDERVLPWLESTSRDKLPRWMLERRLRNLLREDYY